MNRSAVGLWSRWSKRRCYGAELPRAAIRASETRPPSVLAPKQKDVFYVWMVYVSRLRGCLAGTDEGASLRCETADMHAGLSSQTLTTTIRHRLRHGGQYDYPPSGYRQMAPANRV